MNILGLLVVLIIVGFLLWMVNTYIPMAAQIKSLINVIAIVLVVLWLAQSFGLIHGLGLRLK